MRSDDHVKTTQMVLNLFLCEFLKTLSQKLSKQKLDEFVELCENKPTTKRMKTWLEKTLPGYERLAIQQFNQIIKSYSINK